MEDINIETKKLAIENLTEIYLFELYNLFSNTIDIRNRFKTSYFTVGRLTISAPFKDELMISIYQGESWPRNNIRINNGKITHKFMNEKAYSIFLEELPKLIKKIRDELKKLYINARIVLSKHHGQSVSNFKLPTSRLVPEILFSSEKPTMEEVKILYELIEIELNYVFELSKSTMENIRKKMKRIGIREFRGPDISFPVEAVYNKGHINIFLDENFEIRKVNVPHVSQGSIFTYDIHNLDDSRRNNIFCCIDFIKHAKAFIKKLDEESKNYGSKLDKVFRSISA